MASRSKEKQRIALIGPHFDSKFHMPHELTIQYNDDILASVGLSEEAFAKEATFLLAAKLYEQGKLSSGQAAQLCGKGRAEFLYSLPTVGISISNMSPDDVEEELEFARYT